MGKIHCLKVVVDSCDNDPVAIKWGGPEYIGFNFNIRPRDLNRVCDLIFEITSSISVPCRRILYDDGGYVDEEEICSDDQIIEEIYEKGPYLQQKDKRELDEEPIVKVLS